MPKPHNFRDIPPDFAELAATLPVKKLRTYYGAGQKAVERWLIESGMKGKRVKAPRPNDPANYAHLRRPVPEDLAEMRARLRGSDRLAKHYRASWETVKRWLAEAGLPPLKPQPPHNSRPVPADFAVLAPQLTQAELGRHYRAGREIIVRWCAESGVAAKERAPAPRGTFRLPRHPGERNVTILRNYGPEDEAADLLRPHMPIYRADERGRADPKGKFWRAGNSLLDGAELVAKAERYRRRAA